MGHSKSGSARRALERRGSVRLRTTMSPSNISSAVGCWSPSSSWNDISFTSSPKLGHCPQCMQWDRGFKSLQKWSNLYKMLNTCSVLRELGAALNIDTNCRRRRRKDSFLEDEAMMARLVWKAVPFLMRSSGIEPPNWLLAPTPSPEQQLYTESENKHTAWTAEMLLKHCKSAKLARRYNIKLSFLSLSCIHLFLSFCLFVFYFSLVVLQNIYVTPCLLVEWTPQLLYF